MKKYEIRHNTASLKQIEDYLRQADAHFVPSLRDKVDIEDYAKKICEHAETIEAWQDNALIGLLAVYLNNVKYSSAFITSISILKSFHGAGIAKKLMHACIDLATHLNFQEVSLEVGRENGRAIGFYQKIGFSERHRNDESIFMSHNLVQS
jgi:ribosomal protein S18 acetylase RimI-like enzyme